MKEISVIIMCYNRRNFLRGAVRSVLNQTLDKSLFEIIVVKNFKSSIDKFLNRNKIITVLDKQKNAGSNFTKAIKHSSGKIIALLDDDDLWSSDKLEIVHKLFKDNSNLGYYRNNIGVIGKNGPPKILKFLDKSSIRLYKMKWFYIKDKDKPNQINHMINLGINFNNSSISVRRGVLSSKLPQMKKIGLLIDNFLFCSAICSGYDMLAGSKRLTKYRVHGNNASAPSKLNIFFARNSIYISDYKLMLRLFGNKSTDLKKYMKERVASLSNRRETTKFFEYLHT